MDLRRRNVAEKKRPLSRTVRTWGIGYTRIMIIIIIIIIITIITIIW